MITLYLYTPSRLLQITDTWVAWGKVNNCTTTTAWSFISKLNRAFCLVIRGFGFKLRWRR